MKIVPFIKFGLSNVFKVIFTTGFMARQMTVHYTELIRQDKYLACRLGKATYLVGRAPYFEDGEVHAFKVIGKSLEPERWRATPVTSRSTVGRLEDQLKQRFSNNA